MINALTVLQQAVAQPDRQPFQDSLLHRGAGHSLCEALYGLKCIKAHKKAELMGLGCRVRCIESTEQVPE